MYNLILYFEGLILIQINLWNLPSLTWN